jgi:hypothetical protein
MEVRTWMIERSATGEATMSAGGGAFHSTYQAQTILKSTNEGLKLKTALFVKASGHLACSKEQATIPIEVDDVIVVMTGTLPVSDMNPDAKISAYRITAIDTATARATEIPLNHRLIPPEIITGAGKYHNREGTYFCIDPVKKED